jgi:hypothetical protein
MSQDKYIIEFAHGDLDRLMSDVKTVIDDCGIPMAARQKFANTVMRLLKSGKAFIMERADAPGLVMTFKPSDKLAAAFDKIEAAR